MPNRPSEISYEVMVDWDATNWSATPDFSQSYDDISDDVVFNSWTRGEDTDEGNSPAGTYTLRLKPGLHQKYSIYNTSSELYGKIRPWLPIRIRAVHNSLTYTIFTGFIASIRINPSPGVQEVILTVTDGMDLLARMQITQDYDTRTNMSDGEAAHMILDGVGWPSAKRNIDLDGGDELLNYPQTGEY